MPLATGLMLAPSAIKIADSLFGGGSPSAYEKELFKMADVFKAEAAKPLTSSREFTSGRSILDSQDKRNRKAVNASAATTGATDEARLANMQGSNEAYNQGINQLLAHAAQMRDRNRNQYMNLLGAGESAKQNRQGRRQQQFAQILDPLSQAGAAFKMADMFAAN